MPLSRATFWLVDAYNWPVAEYLFAPPIVTGAVGILTIPACNFFLPYILYNDGCVAGLN